MAARYSHGVLLLADTAGLQGRSRLVVASQDPTHPPGANSIGASGLREIVTELEVLLPGGCPDPYAACLAMSKGVCARTQSIGQQPLVSLICVSR